MNFGSTIRIMRLLLAPCLLAVCLCASEDLGPMPKLVPPAWQDGETSGYEVTRDDAVLYRSRVVIAFDEEVREPGASGASAADTTRAIPTLVVVSVVEPLHAESYFFDSVAVVVRRDDLTPLRSFRSLETDISDMEVSARYEPGRVVVNKQTVDGVQESGLRLPPRSYANDAMQTLLRAVPPVSGTVFRINLVVPIDFRTLPVKVSVLGTKLIKTALGDIMCREILLSSPGREARLWYELAEPHRFVGMEDRGNGTQVLLTSYQANTADTLHAAR